MSTRKPIKVFCAQCRTPLYWFVGEVKEGSRLSPTDFRTLTPKARIPRDGEPADCFSCRKPFYMVRRGGGPILLTSTGYLPRPPEGRRVGNDAIRVPIMQATGQLEFRDPRERKAR